MSPSLRHVVAVRGPRGLDLLWVAAGDPSRTAVWPMLRGTEAPTASSSEEAADQLVVALDGGVLTASRDEGSIRVHRLDRASALEGTEVFDVDGPVRAVTAAGGVDDGYLIVDTGDVLHVHRLGDRRRRAGPTTVVDDGGPLSRYSLRAGSEGAALAVGHGSGLITIWRLTPSSGPERISTASFDGPVKIVLLLDDLGETVAVADWSGTVRILDCRQPIGRTLTVLRHGPQLAQVVLLGSTPEGPVAATRSIDGITKFWQVKVGSGASAGRTVPTEDSGLVRCLAATSGGSTNVVATAFEGGRDVTLWGVSTAGGDGERLLSLSHDEEVLELALGRHGDGAAVVCAAGDTAVSLWSLPDSGGWTGRVYWPTENEPVEFMEVQAGADGLCFVVTAGIESLRIRACEPGAGTSEQIFALPEEPVTALTSGTVDGRLVVVAGTDDGLLHVVECNGESLHRHEALDHGEPVSDAVLSTLDDGRRVLVGIGRTGTITVWDLDEADRQVAAWRLLTAITHVTVAAGHLVTVDLTGAAQFWDLARTGALVPVHHVPGRGARTQHLVSSTAPDGTTVVARASVSGTAELVRLPRFDSVVADLNCDVSAMVGLPGTGWIVLAHGAAVVALDMVAHRAPVAEQT